MSGRNEKMEVQCSIPRFANNAKHGGPGRVLGGTGEDARRYIELLTAWRKSDSPFGFAQGRRKAAVATWAWSPQNNTEILCWESFTLRATPMPQDDNGVDCARFRGSLGCSALRGVICCAVYPGLASWAKLCRPFGAGFGRERTWARSKCRFLSRSRSKKRSCERFGMKRWKLQCSVPRFAKDAKHGAPGRVLGGTGEDARRYTAQSLIAASRRSDSPFGFAQGRLKAAVATWAWSPQQIHRSFVGSRSLCERLHCLGMTMGVDCARFSWIVGCSALRGVICCAVYPGLASWAKLCRPFGAGFGLRRHGHDLNANSSHLLAPKDGGMNGPE
jgi:hypothetical protein